MSENDTRYSGQFDEEALGPEPLVCLLSQTNTALALAEPNLVLFFEGSMQLKDARVLVVDDDQDVLTALKLLLRPEVKDVFTEKNPDLLRSFLSRQGVDLILLDMNFNSVVHTGNEGLYWLRKIREWKPAIQVVMITAYGDIDLAVRSLKEGAANFLVKPWQNEKLIETLRQALENQTKSPKTALAEIQPQPLSPVILGASVEMEQISFLLNKIAPTDANVLILGENGTGKELVAQAIHQQSMRANRPFVKIDLGSLTESLFESELFGHKKGAFTDAREDRVGRIEMAHGGTLFLDEIGNITLQQQARLLSVLQNRKVIPLGSNQEIPIDIRLICATNVPISLLSDESRFRKDLMYRINTVEISLPPLRRRQGDILLLARHFAGLFATKYNRPIQKLSEAVEKKLQRHPFPGNVRELQFTLERAVIMAENGEIRPEDIAFSPLERAPGREDEGPELQLSAVEKRAILQAIEKHNGNLTNAAKELGLTRTALYRRLDKYKL